MNTPGPNTPATLLSVQNLTMRFGGLTAIDDLSLDVPAAPKDGFETRELPLGAPGEVPAGGVAGMTDSIQPTTAVLSAPNIRVVSTDALLGEAISRTAQEQSVSSLFN